MIENKWKRFAMGEVLSDWEGDASPEYMFDLIVNAEDSELPDVFEENGIAVWEPYEDWSFASVADYALSLAQRAQEVAAYVE